jgi:hypothetical protein
MIYSRLRSLTVTGSYKPSYFIGCIRNTFNSNLMQIERVYKGFMNGATINRNINAAVVTDAVTVTPIIE